MGFFEFREFEFDYNSLISSDPLGWDWISDATLSLQPAQYNSNDIGVERALILNLLGGAPNPGRTRTSFRLPSDCPGGQLLIGAKVRSGTNSIRLSIYDDALSSPVAQSIVQLTTAPQTFAVPATMSAGQYWVTIDVNSGAPVSQAQPIIFEPQFVPYPASSGLFAKRTKRLRMMPSLISGNYYYNSVSGRYFRQMQHAEFNCKTDATRWAMESWVQGPGAGSNNITMLVNRIAERAGATTNDQTIAIDEWDIPQRQTGMNTVGARCGQNTQWLATSTYQQALRAAYFPEDATVEPFARRANGQVLVMISDSIGAGQLATNPTTQGGIVQVKSRWPGGPDNVYVDAAGSKAINHIAVDAATVLSTALTIARADPSDILWHIGVNDYITNFASWTQAAIQTAFGNLLDKVHLLLPKTKMWVISPIVRSVETANANGVTLGNVRSAIQTVATDPTRTDWCAFLSGLDATMPTLTYIADGTHPNNDGQAILGTGYCKFLGI